MNLRAVGGCCTSCYIFDLRGAAITLSVIKWYCIQRFSLFFGEWSGECVRPSSGDYNITDRSHFDTNGAIPELLV